MFTILGVLTAALISAVTLGLAFDKVANQNTKTSIFGYIGSINRDKLLYNSIDTVISLYESVFGKNIKSLRFIKNSAFVFFWSFLCLCLGLYFINRYRFFSVIAPFINVQTASIVYWLMFTVLGFGVFWLANAQTLYFLRIARKDPKPIPVFLLFYADVLLTAALCIFGIGLLLYAYLVHVPNSISARVDIEIRVEQSTSRFSKIISDSSTPPQVAASLLSYYQNNTLDIKNTVEFYTKAYPSANAISVFRKDMGYVYDYLPSSSSYRVFRVSDDLQQIVDKQGRIISFQSITGSLGRDFSPRIYSITQLERFCHQLTTLQPASDNNYMRINSFYVSKGSKAACLKGQPFRVGGIVQFNMDNVSHQYLIQRSFYLVFDSILSGLGLGDAGTNSSSSINTYNLSSNIWLHDHVISEDRSLGGYNARDIAFINAYAIELGKYNLVLHNNIPFALSVSIIMMTTLGTLVLFLSSFIASAIGNFLLAINLMVAHIKFEEFPFTILFIIASLFGFTIWLIGGVA